MTESVSVSFARTARNESDVSVRSLFWWSLCIRCGDSNALQLKRIEPDEERRATSRVTLALEQRMPNSCGFLPIRSQCTRFAVTRPANHG
jgi:hypothetical protein